MAETRETNAAPETGAASTVTPAVRRRLQQCFEHASKLMQQEKRDFDYANTLLTECVQQDPANLVYLEKFFDNLQAKYDNNKKGARFAGFGGRGPFKKAVAKKDWLEVLREGAALLKTNPWDVATLRPMAEACEALDFREVELRYLRNALDANPRDPEVNRHCAKSLQRMGHFDQAIVCWHRVEEALRNDEEAPRMISQLQIEKTRARAGFGDPAARGKGGAAAAAGAKSPASSPSSPAPGSPATSHAAAESHHADTAPSESGATKGDGKREVTLTPRQRLERQIAEDPAEVGPYLELAQVHLDEHRLADAEAVLKRALSISSHDLRLRERYEDVTIQRHRQQLHVAERMAATEKTREAQELVVQVRQELNRVELEVFRGRCERYPKETAYQLQFAVRLKRANNLAAAVVQFSELVEGSPQAVAAALELGECYQLLKQYPLALQWYRQAVDRAVQADQPEIRKLALYRGGVLAQALQDLPTAQSMYQQLVDLDEGYKDAADRLDKIRPMRDKGAS